MSDREIDGSKIDERIHESDVVEAIERIRKDDEDNLVKPEDVVEAARDENSPLHKFFTWDDSEAAHKHRLWQARMLIVRVRVVEPENRIEMVNVKIDKSDGTRVRGYVPVKRAARDPDMYDQVVEDSIRAVTSYRNRLSAFSQAEDLVKALDEALAKMKKARFE